MDNLSGTVARITYYNSENGYTVLRLDPDEVLLPGIAHDGTVTAVGNLPEVAVGEHLELEGRWTQHPEYGTQFKVEICRQTLSSTLAGIQRYLGSGLIKGIGSELAQRIVDHFKEETLQVIEREPNRLKEVSGIGARRLKDIRRAWEEHREIKEIMLFLHSRGVNTNLAVKIYQAYGDESLQIVQRDPYQLERDIRGIGFKTADQLARHLGLPADHPSRIEAGLVYSLNELIASGHVYAPQEKLIQQSMDLLECDETLLIPALDRLGSQGRIQFDQIPAAEPKQPSEPSIREMESESYSSTTAVYLTPFHYAETGSALLLKKLALQLPSSLSDIPPAFAEQDAALGKSKLALSPQQRSAVLTTLSHPVSVLTGGPGTGKTTCLRYLVSILETQHKRIALASPTGRAAKRLSQATGLPASTLHRLLGYSPLDGFKHDADNPLPVDILVVDEASMLDILLTYNLLKALAPGTHLLLVGDVDQLPSVGAGNVLRDIIDSGLVPVTRLELIFRQAAGSNIITNAHRINQGNLPTFLQEEGKETDFYLFPAADAPAASDWIIDLVSHRIPQEFELDPREDIQVLSSLYRGPAGVDALNQHLQLALNPASDQVKEQQLMGTLFREGDKLMQIQNNYAKEVFNGDIGRLVKINSSKKILVVDFDGILVEYEWTEAEELVLAYAVSVHKSQGAEFPAVVLPVITQHYIMLQRNLLYTAVTRARRLCVLAGNRKAIAIAVGNNQISRRHSALSYRLAAD